MKFLLYALPVLFLIACNHSIESEETNSVQRDSIGFKNESASAIFDSKAFNLLSLPLVIDTNFIILLDTNDRIPYQLIRQLAASYLKDELNGGLEYTINTFCKIDSLKHNDEYKEYVEKLDIGMTKQSIAYKIGVVKFKNGNKLFLWGITQSSYEACPFFAGTTIVGTYVTEKNENTHFIIGEISSAGDPPSTGNEEITALISDEKIIIKSRNVSDDMDVPGEEVTNRMLVVEPGLALKILETKKDINSTEKVNQ